MCLPTKKRALIGLVLLLCCGERGIRTPGASQLNGFQDRRNRPLCHLSSKSATKVLLFFDMTKFFCKKKTAEAVFFHYFLPIAYI